MNKNFMYGVGAVKYKDFVVGYIEKNSFDMGGQKPESAKIEAEQVPGTPVLIIPQSNGSIAPTFNVIQLNYENLHSLLGGTMHYKEEDSEKKTPIISVTCSYPGANSEVIENQITEPLEQNINGIPGIRSLSSTSQQGQCRITNQSE
jgi:hypothetical protein